MQNLHQQDLSREFLATLDQAALVELVLQFNFEYKTLDSKFQVLAKHARNAIAEKYGQKTERFEHPGQLLLFPSQAESSPTEGSKPRPQKSSTKTSRPGHTRNPKPDLPHFPVTPPAPDESDRDGPMTYLAEFTGRLQGDCFSGNLAICASIDTIRVACNAHDRRYFVKSMLNDKEGSSEALSIFQSLYEIERTAKEFGLTPEQTQLMREQEATPILKEFRKCLQQQQLFAQPKSSYGKAIFYCLNNWKALTQYVNDGRLSIDNNHSEREMKYIAMGRKAWLFFGSDKGGKNHAIMLSIISTDFGK